VAETCVAQRVNKGAKTTRIERVYLITRQARAQADPAQLLALNRASPKNP